MHPNSLALPGVPMARQCARTPRADVKSFDRIIKRRGGKPPPKRRRDAGVALKVTALDLLRKSHTSPHAPLRVPASEKQQRGETKY
jgi:hypothetical protein